MLSKFKDQVFYESIRDFSEGTNGSSIAKVLPLGRCTSCALLRLWG